MTEESIQQVKYDYTMLLSALGIGELRAVGRFSGVPKPTTKKKEELIAEIIAVELGEQEPVARSTVGAPVKADFINDAALKALQDLRIRVAVLTGKSAGGNNPLFPERDDGGLIVRSASYDAKTERVGYYEQERYEGQVEIYKNAYCLFPLDARFTPLETEFAVLSLKQIQEHRLRVGDVVFCHSEKRGNVRGVREILSVNGLSSIFGERFSFEKEEISYPEERIVLNATSGSGLVAKTIDWLFPIGFGCRGLCLSSNKRGTYEGISEILNAVNARSDVKAFVFLCATSPERAAEFKEALPADSVVCSSFEDPPEFIVHAAEYILTRAKRAAESGRKVVLFVDSFNALARAYDQTENSSSGKTFACGMETKTAQYVRSFFASGRKFSSGSSLTVLGGVIADGDEWDACLRRELETVANHTLKFKKTPFGELSLDVQASSSEFERKFFSESERSWVKRIRSKDDETVSALLKKSDSYETFVRNFQKNEAEI